MLATLDFDLRPGFGLGIFELGMYYLKCTAIAQLYHIRTGTSLWTVLDLLRHNTTLFPRVDVKYDPDASASTPIILHIHPHLDLLFTGQQQRLRTIALRRLHDPNPPVQLQYKDVILSSQREILRRGDVSRHFGPTYPGDGLAYPGVSFLFEEDGVTSGNIGKDDRTREVKRVVVTQSTPDNTGGDALDEVTECSSMAGDIRQAIVKVNRTYKKALYDLTMYLGSRRCFAALLSLDFKTCSRAFRCDKCARSHLRSRSTLAGSLQGRREDDNPRKESNT